jgi:hypothetical protein
MIEKDQNFPSALQAVALMLVLMLLKSLLWSAMGDPHGNSD